MKQTFQNWVCLPKLELFLLPFLNNWQTFLYFLLIYKHIVLGITVQAIKSYEWVDPHPILKWTRGI